MHHVADANRRHSPPAGPKSASRQMQSSWVMELVPEQVFAGREASSRRTKCPPRVPSKRIPDLSRDFRLAHTQVCEAVLPGGDSKCGIHASTTFPPLQ
eukprot:72734-Rhodomonas_salina.3